MFENAIGQPHPPDRLATASAAAPVRVRATDRQDAPNDTGNTRFAAHLAAQNTRRTNVLSMERHERMAGSVPVWRPARAAPEVITQTLAQATQVAPETANAATTQGMALSYNPDAAAQAPQTSDEFSFGDLVDMVNPLHHIPLVGHLYRHITGDTIKPPARVLGGTLFGGPLGGAAGLINVIAEHETGQDVTGLMVSSLNGTPTPASGIAATSAPHTTAAAAATATTTTSASAIAAATTGTTAGTMGTISLNAFKPLDDAAIPHPTDLTQFANTSAPHTAQKSTAEKPAWARSWDNLND